VVLLLGLDGRVHLGRLISTRMAQLPTPGFLAVVSVLVVYAGRVLVLRLLAWGAPAASSSIVRVVE
jgi:hypothetical protein